ncbi:MAG TPA: hypothetical protein DCE71_05920 [Parachlamydiales bacterium]|nr:hypothetical protein [Parachlamydiales bacterium]
MSRPDATPSPDRIDPNKSIEPQTSIRSQTGSDFQTFMQGGGAKPTAASTTGAPSPLELTKPSQQLAAPTFNTLLAQSANMQDSLGTLQDQLSTPNLKLKRSQAHLLRNKLGDANNYIRGAAGKLGIDTPPIKMPSHPGVTERLMAYINDGQEKMVGVQQKLDELMGRKEQLSPGDMMMVQVKMGQAQQEIEYSSTVLSKVIDALKQLFNIQL